MKCWHLFKKLNFLSVLLITYCIYKIISDKQIIKLNVELLGMEIDRMELSQFKEYWPVNVDLFSSTLKEKADANGTIIISMVDGSFIDMAINLFETSFKRHNITNYIFLCAHRKATKKLISSSINAISVWNNEKGELPSFYGSVFFSKKTIYKTVAATLGLKMGFIIVVMDTDIVLLKNPYPYLVCNNCDMIFSTEGNTDTLNTGFYVAFPTRNTILIHEYVIKMVTESNFGNNEQDIFNRLLKRSIKVKVKNLNHRLFQNGRSFFELGKRMFAGINPCFACVLVHNNYVLSYNHKVYRFKEHLLWMSDDKQYYSSPNRKYLMYKNQYYLGEKKTMIAEEKALKNAFLLGYILNRTVILPKFFCYLCRQEVVTAKRNIPMCAANIHFNINIMDKYLTDKYRENMFLSHPKVPIIVKSSISGTVLFETNFYIEKKVFNQSDDFSFKDVEKYFTLRDEVSVFTIEDIIEHLKPLRQYSVIRFHSLYGNLVTQDVFDAFDREKLTGIKSLHLPNYRIVHFLNNIL